MRPGGFNLLPDVVKNLLIINGIGFLATLLFQFGLNINLIGILGLYVPSSSFFEPYQIVTHLFMHGGFFHILVNMFVLYMFGSVLENVMGSQRLFILYFVSGFGAVALHLGVNYIDTITLANELIQAGVPQAKLDQLAEAANQAQRNDVIRSVNNLTPEIVQQMKSLHASYVIPTVGASGAVFGLLAAFGLLFPNSYLYVMALFPVKAKYLVILIGIAELYSELTGAQGNIAHLAHLGGMIFGFLLIKTWGYKRFN